MKRFYLVSCFTLIVTTFSFSIKSHEAPTAFRSKISEKLKELFSLQLCYYGSFIKKNSSEGSFSFFYSYVQMQRPPTKVRITKVLFTKLAGVYYQV